jgi:hypothetical protein
MRHSLICLAAFACVGVFAPDNARADQPGWRWCHKCQGMFFNDNPTKGVCPADGKAHDASQSGKYVMSFGETEAAEPSSPGTFGNVGQQGDWRWCSKCQGLFFAGHATHGVCPADNNQHTTAGSGHYAMRNSGKQNSWRWCQKCEGMFFAGNASKGVCPADHKSHDASKSGNYGMFFETPPPK